MDNASSPFPSLRKRFVGIWLMLALSLTGIFSSARAQSSLLTDAPHLSQYIHESWQTEEGLPQNSIFTILQARDGYVWIGTQEGLVRFDGKSFTVFDKAHHPALPSNEIRALLEDRSGNLWIGTNGGITRYTEGTFTTFTTTDGLSSDLVRTLHEDQQGTLWIGTIEGGLNRFDGTSFSHFTTADGLAGNVVLSIEEATDGSLWIGTEAGLSHLRNNTFTSYSVDQGLPEPPVWALHEGMDGGLWVGTSNGLAHLQDDTFSIISTRQGLCGDVVSAIEEAPGGSLWIATLDGGVCQLRDRQVESFGVADGLTHPRVRSIYTDNEKNIWIGTEGGGLNRLRRGKFTPISTAQGLSADVVFTVLEDRQGSLWIGTEGGGLNRINASGLTHFTTQDGLLSPNIFALHEGRSNLWIGMYHGGLCSYDADRFTCFSTKDGLSSDDVYALLEDRTGTLWVGTENGLNQYRDGQFSLFEPASGTMQTAITALHESRDATLWVGGFEGLTRLRGDEATTFTQQDGLSSDIVLTLYEDHEETLWIGTQEGGLCRLKNEHLACITSRDGLANDNVLQIVENDDGHLWLGSLKGISRVPKDAIHAVLDGQAARVASTVFDRHDGLLSAEMSGGTQPSAWRSRDGRLWFATAQGIVHIDPAHISTNTLAPPVQIESISVNGQPAVRPSAQLTLAPGSKDIAFQYTGLSFIAPEKVTFAYLLDGYDENWVEAGSRREAYYTNLSPGAYTFRVRARNADGVWNETGAHLALVIQPHFFQTTWFLVLCGLLMLGVAFGAYRWRISHLKARERDLEAQVAARTHDLRQEKEQTEHARQVIEAQAHKLKQLDHFKTRFFANISHEFRTPLTMILGPLQNALLGSYGPLDGGLRRQVEIMQRNALRLTRLINQLLDLSKLEAGKMQLRARPRQFGSFLEGIVFSCTAFAEQKGIALTAQVGQEPIELYFEPDKLEKVFFNLISNALKFTPAGGAVLVSATTDAPTEDFPAGSVTVQVSDTGAGIPAEHLNRIFDRFQQVDDANTRKHEGSGIGLSLAREMILLHHGTITVESEVGKGTTFHVTLPLGKAHLQHEEVILAEDNEEAADGALLELAAAYDFGDDHALLAPSGSDNDRPLILVVDDNADVREYIGSILAPSYRLAQARHGQEGLEQAQAQLPDLILSDVMMPVMDGHALCKAVKSEERLNHIPVILLTAKASHQDKLEGLEEGADDFLAKPFNAQELQARIRNLLKLRSQEKELKVLNTGLEAQVRDQLEAALQERKQYEARLLEAKERAEASSRLKSAILDNMSHELRTPIASIQGFGEILASEVDEQHQEFARYIIQNAQRLLETLSDVLDLAQLESEQVEIHPEKVDVNTCVQQVVAHYSAQATAKALPLHFRAAPTPAYGATDPAALARLLGILVGNAIKYTEEGEIHVQVEKVQQQVTITVRDTGIGISEAFLPHLFEAFQQESAGLMREHEGNGLGLSIAKRLVELLQGTITVDSQKGVGSTFKVFLPALSSSPKSIRPSLPNKTTAS